MRKNKSPSNLKILITGGHLTPALALAEELIEQDKKNIVWVGQKHSQTGDKSLSAEYGQVTKRGIRFISLKSGKVWRKWTRTTFFKGLINLLLIPIGFLRAFTILAIEKPDVIISFGGHLSVPILGNSLINKINGSKIYIHTQTLKPDLSTRKTVRFADKIFLTWSESRKYYKGRKIEVVGNPIRQELLNSKVEERFFQNDLPILFIIGGNQGSNTFNKRLRLPILEKYLEKMNIVHQTGSSSLTHDFQTALDQKKRLSENLQEKYKVYNFITTTELNNIYNQTALILSRSGANTVYEILFKGIPAIFMPLPWAAQDEQMENAQIATQTGLAQIFEFTEELNEQDLFTKIKRGMEQINDKISFNDKYSWTKAKQNAKKEINLSAAQLLADSI